MKSLFGAFALFVLAGIVAAAPADAKTALQTQMPPTPQTKMQMQGQIPAGSYQSSCTNARMLGGSLIAFCRTANGTWQTTGIAEVDQCRGNIGNLNGTLSCNRATTTAAAPAPTTAASQTPKTGAGTSAPNASYPPPAYGSTTQPGYPPPSSGGTTKPAYPPAK